MSDIQKDAMKLTAAALVILLAVAALGGCVKVTARPVVEESTWPESAEFSTIETGADRFSEHGTNLEGVVVLVDHVTGVQYAMSAGGLCPLLDVDGTPLLVAEAGS